MALPSVTLKKIRIKDGVFSRDDHKTGRREVVENINADIAASGLAGPFTAQGSAFYDGHVLDFDIESGQYDHKNRVLSPKIKVEIKPVDVVVDYAGVIDFTDIFSIQGQTTVRIENPDRLLSHYNIDTAKGFNQPFESKGLLSMDTKKLDYTDITAQLGQAQIQGAAHLNLDRLTYDIKLKTLSDIDIQAISGGMMPFRAGAFDARITGNDTKMTLHKSSMTLDGHAVTIAGQYTKNNKTNRPEIKLDVTTKEINYDNIMGGADRQNRKTIDTGCFVIPGVAG